MTLFKHSTLLLWLLLAGSFTPALATPADLQPYHLVTEEWAPYNYLSNGQVTGLTTEVVRAIMARTGDAFALELQPSMRSTLTLRTHTRTIMFSLFRTPAREGLYKWVGPIVDVLIHPYQLASAQPPIMTREQLLRAPRITTRQAGLVPEEMAAQGFDNLDQSASGNLPLYRMLLAGRTEVIVGDSDAGVAYYSRLLAIAPGTLRQVPVEIYRAPLYIAFSRDSDDALVARWAAALEDLRRSGELARIEQHYAEFAGPGESFSP